MYKVMRYEIVKVDYSKGYYNPTVRTVHEWEEISERDLIALLLDHGKESIVDFLMFLVENPYSWGTVNEVGSKDYKPGHVSIQAMWEPK